ncbi:MAG TPA: hypothetical protein VFS00_17820 [Polyangiaceae bacterium]|nr:hypothetical protein [Polyangiaceae bacterium]
MSHHLPVASHDETLAPTQLHPRARLRRVPADGRPAAVAERRATRASTEGA